MLAPLIPVRGHGVLDYLVGIFLIVAPWLARYHPGDVVAFWVSIGFGIATILYSLLTDYPLGLAPVIPMRVHLWIDLLSGIFLLIVPFAAGWMARGVWPLPAVGLMEIIVALISATHTRRSAGDGAAPAVAGM